ncbi:hypothetical protein J4423_00630 [Candidatus Pacearchaeota archaeon]|nr:hypothetical protein [Candidatus Pacearchaeota archaeon]
MSKDVGVDSGGRDVTNYDLDLTKRLGDKNSRISPSHIPPMFYLTRALGLEFCSNGDVRRYEPVVERGKIIDGRFGSPGPA